MNAGHNSKDQYEEQQFLRGFREIQDLKSDMAGRMAEINHVYKRLKEVGFTKADVKWAMELDEKDAPEVLAMWERRMRIAKMLGHGVARQMEFFDKDRTPIEERAFEEGLAAGKLRKANVNPYGGDSEAGRSWQRGFNEGTIFINKELSKEFDDEDEEEDGDPDFPVAAE